MKIVLKFLLFFVVSIIYSQNYRPSEENLANREWFQNAKFGMFIHWGVYSVLGDGEWVMQQKKIDKKTYERLAGFFNPVEFNPQEWVSIAKNAGMKYITITTRHHDGFSMFYTKQSDWNIVDKTPYKKDIIKLLAEECEKQGIKLFFYYSLVDWYHDDYFPRGMTGQYSGRPDTGNWNNYINFMKAQLTELLTNYGSVAGIWFDGLWDKKNADWKLKEIYELIHKLQPACLIGNNHHLAPIEGEDFQMFEKDLPGRNTSGFSGEAEIGRLPLETCETINNSWGFNLLDKNFKSVKELIQYLVKAAGNNANFLLNVGPMPNGKIQPEFVSRLKEIGDWLNRYGESIYGTRGGPVPQKSWGVTTQKDSKVYIHILNYENQNLLLPDFGKKIKNIYLFDGTKLNYKQDSFGIAIKIPEEKIDPVDTIIIAEY
ncbi:alpha-L-fucosidase [Rosettibacter firmus]|uniref:alpha-L-fucosidase n=1 Tax=Rosettibacter firmus TaxID=3111522 RepID=UPI00336C0266